jgi:hypothetical protein
MSARDAAQEEDLILEHPEACAPGNTDMLIPRGSVAILQRLQAERELRTYHARAYLSSEYSIAVSAEEVVKCCTRTQIKLVGGVKKWQIRPFRRPICFDLEPDEDGWLESVSGYARADLPLAALDLFKSAVALLTDRLVVLHEIPLYIQRTELYLDRCGHKVVEVTFPSRHEIQMQHGGAYDLPAFFLAYWSLEREAICAPSPIYRFMCRWRAFETIPRIRSSLRSYAQSIGCQARLPKVPVISQNDRHGLRLPDETHRNARTLEDVVRCYGDLRDAVAHFWSGDAKAAEKGTVLPFRSLDVASCEEASQVIRLCNRRLVDPLWSFFTQHLSATYSRGQIYATEQQYEEFCAVADALQLYLKPSANQEGEHA